MNSALRWRRRWLASPRTQVAHPQMPGFVQPELHSTHLSRLAWPLVAIVALVSSATGLGNGFAYDDLPIIANNAAAHTLSSWWTFFASPYWPPAYGESLYRPLAMVAYAAEWTAGQGSPLVFHAVSVLLYAALAVVVLALLMELLDVPGALAGALLFAAHPLHTEAVANVVGQAELLAALGVTGALTLFFHKRERLDAATMVTIVLLYAAAALSKEHALLFPALLVTSALLVRQPGSIGGHRRLLWLVTGLAAAGAAVLLARTLVLDSLLGEQHPVEMTWAERIWTMFRVVPEWVRLMAWPARLSAEYGPQQIEVAGGPGLLSLLGVVICVLCAAAFVASISRARVLAFGLAWIAITFLPVSNLVSGVVLQERTLMLPSVGFVIVAGAVFQWAWVTSDRAARGGLAAIVLTLVVLGAWRSALRNPVWRDNATLFAQTVKDAPRSYRAHYVQGMELFNAGRPAEGEQELRLALELSRHDSDPYNFLATKYREAGLYEAAIPLYREALTIRPGRPDARFGLAYSLLETGDLDGALAQADTGLRTGQLRSYFEYVRTAADSIRRARPTR